MELLIAGDPTDLIAERLVISQRTVSFHVLRMYKRFGVGNRVQLVRKVLELGLMKLPD